MIKNKLFVLIITFILILFFNFNFFDYDKNIITFDNTISNNIKLNNKIPKIIDGASKPNIYAKNWGLYDVNSSTLVAGLNYNNAVPIASITKLMTALLVLEKAELSEVVIINKEDTLVNGSKILLRTNESITVEKLLNGLLINSGNDAAYSLARYIGSKNERLDPINTFVDMMNQKALNLNMKDTKYFDPAGLDDNGKSSVRDQAKLLSILIKNTTFNNIVLKKEATVTSEDGSISHQLDNSNRLVKDEMYLSGVIGGKTGFTPTAGHNLICAASRDGNTIISIIFNTYSSSNSASAIESKKLLEWGFSNIIWNNI